jgi:resolvase-like protein
MIAAIYARKSTGQHVADDAKSVTRQVANAKAFAASKGWEVRDELVFTDDGVSGSETKRLLERTRMIEWQEDPRRADRAIRTGQMNQGREPPRLHGVRTIRTG